MLHILWSGIAFFNVSLQILKFKSRLQIALVLKFKIYWKNNHCLLRWLQFSYDCTGNFFSNTWFHVSLRDFGWKSHPHAFTPIFYTNYPGHWLHWYLQKKNNYILTDMKKIWTRRVCVGYDCRKQSAQIGFVGFVCLLHTCWIILSDPPSVFDHFVCYADNATENTSKTKIQIKWWKSSMKKTSRRFKSPVIFLNEICVLWWHGFTQCQICIFECLLDFECTIRSFANVVGWENNWTN